MHRCYHQPKNVDKGDENHIISKHFKQKKLITASLWISDTSPAMGFLVEMSLWALVMAFYTLFMVFGPEKNFKLISGRFGENPEFLCFQLFFRPQKVFLLPIFLLLT